MSGNTPEFILPLAPGQAHEARLNGIALLESVQAACNKLLDLLNEGEGDALSLRTYTVPATVKIADLPEHLRKLRSVIAKSCGTHKTNVLLRRDASDWRAYYFVANRKCSVGQRLTEIGEARARRAFELTLQALMLKRAGLFSGRLTSAVAPGGRAAELYLLINNPRELKKARRALDCLQVDLFLSHHDKLIVDAKRQMFSVPTEGEAPASTVTPVITGESVARLALLDSAKARRGDARSKGSRKAIPDITLDVRYVRNSRWYAINQLMGMVRDFLTASGVRFRYLDFTATHCLHRSYLKPECLGFPGRLSVVYAPSLRPDQGTKWLLERDIVQNLARKGAAAIEVEWVCLDEVDTRSPLLRDRGYLFLNAAVSQAAEEDQDEERLGSCLLKGEPAEPETAFAKLALKEIALEDVDPYTRIKYVNLVGADSVLSCFQGIDVEDGLGELIGTHKLKKALAEVALKWSLVEGRVASGEALPDGELRATYTRASRPPKTKGVLFETIAYVDLAVEQGGKSIKIQASRIPPGRHFDVADALEALPLIKKSRRSEQKTGRGQVPSASLRNATFVLEMIGEGVADECLVVYDGSTVAVPRIIGHMDQPLLHEQIDGLLAGLPDGQKYLSRSKQHNLLPYYIEGFERQRGRGDFLFIDGRNEMYLRYFVPSLQPLDPKFGFSRFCDIMLYRKSDEARADPIPVTVDHPLVKAYFSMMTQDVVRLSENGKHTLAKKLADLALLN